jgi:ribosomal protein S18 acetylase RimI-like enzyme
MNFGHQTIHKKKKMNQLSTPIPKERLVQIKSGDQILLRFMQKEDLEGIWNNFNEIVKHQDYLPVYTPVVSDWEKNSWYRELTAPPNFCLVAIDPLHTRASGASKNSSTTKHSKLFKPSKESHASDVFIAGQLTIENLHWEAAPHVGQLGIIIHERYRNQGLGFHLIEFAKEIAKSRGKKKLILSTFTDNKPGIHLYNKCGFSTVGTYTKQYFLKDRYIDELLMECWIDDNLESRNTNR